MCSIGNPIALSLNSPAAEVVLPLAVDRVAGSGAAGAVKTLAKGFFAEAEMLVKLPANLLQKVISTLKNLVMFNFKQAFSDLLTGLGESVSFIKTMVTLPFILFASLFTKKAMFAYLPSRNGFVQDVIANLEKGDFSQMFRTYGAVLGTICKLPPADLVNVVTDDTFSEYFLSLAESEPLSADQARDLGLASGRFFQNILTRASLFRQSVLSINPEAQQRLQEQLQRLDALQRQPQSRQILPMLLAGFTEGLSQSIEENLRAAGIEEPMIPMLSEQISSNFITPLQNIQASLPGGSRESEENGHPPYPFDENQTGQQEQQLQQLALLNPGRDPFSYS